MRTFLGVFEISQKGDYYLRRVCLSFRMEQLGSYWTDFHEIWYLNFFSKIGPGNLSIVKSDKNNGHFTWRPVYIYDNISLSSS